MALDPEEYPELNDYAKEGLEWALKKIAQNGITSICDARTYWFSRGHHKTWQNLNKRCKLTARTILGLWAYPEFEDFMQMEKLRNLFDNKEKSRCEILTNLSLYGWSD